MKLSDVMSAMNLAAYAEVGLVLFLAAFVLIAIELVRRGKSMDDLAGLPLESTDRRASDDERVSP